MEQLIPKEKIQYDVGYQENDYFYQNIHQNSRKYEVGIACKMERKR